ncbi:ankyrin repeat domain-containing protein SOWAHB [Rhineura floridana]|uniref:ankyrin repeat domain-containing protein SOWAHB n=1 Tax=Rhineura floridana TaxID=261503 RepID=UPI002AC856D7|nr:ankyrin repeat domain-containing protein SOWAHB [Rhineura floridana]
MAQELSQAEVLDFLCQAGGRVANAVLLGHFKRFLRDPEASPAELQRRRELFKGFVNSVATVRQEGPGAAKYVVLRKRYRELVGEEPKPPAAAPETGEIQTAKPSPPLEVQDARGALQGQAESERAPRAHGGGCRGEPPRRQVEEERACRDSAHELRACPGSSRCPPGDRRGRSGAQLPSSPDLGCQGRPSEGCAPLGVEEPGQTPPGDPLLLLGGAPQSNGPCLPVEELGAPPSVGNPQQRILEWVERAHAVTHHSSISDQREEGSWPTRHSPPSTVRNACPSPPQDSQFGQPLALDARRDHVPVFRSIRCQLSLQDLEDFIEKASSASEDGSSVSGGSDSCRREGGTGIPYPLPGRQNGHLAERAWTGLNHKPHQNGLLVVGPPAKENAAQEDGPIPEHLALLSQVVGRAAALGKPSDKDSKRPSRESLNPRKVARLSPSNLEAPLSPRLVPRQGRSASTPDVEGLGLDAEESSEHRSSLVPLDPREHAWLVKVATGSWMQARALFLEDPHLATRKDFIFGYTVLHWLAKHGNAQVLQDFVTGAKKAGMALDVNVRSGCGYTPLHLAAMHGHQLVIKLLVQKLHCSIQMRDSSGKRPWQYLSSATSGEVWQLLGAPRGKTIFPACPISRSSPSLGRKGKSLELARKISRKSSLAAYLKPQHIKWKMANKYPPLQEEYSD